MIRIDIHKIASKVQITVPLCRRNGEIHKTKGDTIKKKSTWYNSLNILKQMSSHAESFQHFYVSDSVLCFKIMRTMKSNSVTFYEFIFLKIWCTITKFSSFTFLSKTGRIFSGLALRWMLLYSFTKIPRYFDIICTFFSSRRARESFGCCPCVESSYNVLHSLSPAFQYGV